MKNYNQNSADDQAYASVINAMSSTLMKYDANQIKSGLYNVLVNNDFSQISNVSSGRTQLKKLDRKSIVSQLKKLALAQLQKDLAKGTLKDAKLYNYFKKNIYSYATPEDFYKSIITAATSNIEEELMKNKDSLNKNNNLQTKSSYQHVSRRTIPQKRTSLNQRISNQQNNLRQRAPLQKPQGPKDLYVVSDFHGNIEGYNKAVTKLMAGNRIIILGDAMDRGEYGMEILEGIKNLNKSGYDIEYIPGNHDEFLYKCLHDGMRKFEQTRNINDFKSIVTRNAQITMEYQERNGVVPTYQKVIKMANTSPQKLYNLGIWLENQPLLRIESDSRKRVALGHAAFDMDVYNFGYTLRDHIEKRYPNLYEKAQACLWYRDSPQFDEMKNILVLPDTQIADDIVVGHTASESIRIVGKNGTRIATSVDGNLNHNLKIGNNILKKYTTKNNDSPYTSLYIPDSSDTSWGYR